MNNRTKDLVTRKLQAKRGAIKAFRELLNKTYTGHPHAHNRYRQRTRWYGDYLYAQDRDKFEYEFQSALQGEYRSLGFDPTMWVKVQSSRQGSTVP
jgi:hypothetical protein